MLQFTTWSWLKNDFCKRSNIKDNIKVNTHNLSSLINESQKNETIEINLVKENDQNKAVLMVGEFKHEVRQFEKSYDNQQAEQISLMV